MNILDKNIELKKKKIISLKSTIYVQNIQFYGRQFLDRYLRIILYNVYFLNL